MLTVWFVIPFILPMSFWANSLAWWVAKPASPSRQANVFFLFGSLMGYGF